MPVKNGSEDYVVPSGYRAARIAGSKILPLDRGGWDFEALLSGPIDPAWRREMETYLGEVWAQPGALIGWKLPEMVFCYPWLVRAYPEVRIVEIFRDPRDTVLKPHVTDRINEWCRHVPAPPNPWQAKGQSWALQAELMLATAQRLPAWRWCRFRLRDMVHHPGAVRGALGAVLGRDVGAVQGHRAAIGRWRSQGDGYRPMLPWVEQHLRVFNDSQGPFGPAVRDERGYRLLLT